ncbi:MAG: toprim domain-containing protein [Nitrobacter sp.]|uniref:DUF7146 domain-containing protein n=1 Tax=Nitrobacter sp. TaxID=29420 RepID=UPI0026239904|nr:toprim domain-containing protein [Nitrobacter sp.]MCV0387404.1 toprim domain-containing protein [Nitrobacter sp.]
MTVALQQLAASLGGDVVGSRILCPGPGHSPRDRSLSITPSNTAPDGFIVHSFANDDWRPCRDHVMARLGRPLEESAAPARAPVRDHGSAAVALWNAARDPHGTLAERYLASRRLDLGNDVANRVVRFAPECPWRNDAGTFDRRPVMLTAFRTIVGDRLVAVHRTLLSDDGRKLDRRMLGPVAGAAIKVDADENVEQGLAIAEGFETALAGRMLGFRPVWALGSAGAIAAFPVLPGIDALTILAETDDTGANARAAKECGRRWRAAGREIFIATPRVVGDLNDALVST